MACALDLEVGVYNQISNNLHVYTERWEPEKWLGDIDPKRRTMYSSKLVKYEDSWKSFRLFKGNYKQFDCMMSGFVDQNLNGNRVILDNSGYDFLNKIAQPMMHAFHMHKKRDYPLALHWMERVEAPDWCIAGTAWIKRRQLAWKK
jgi:hypothetical protein